MREIDANTILIGTNQGRMLRVSWTGANWNKVQLTSPAPRYISCIAVDPTNPQRIWLTISQIGGGLVYRSDNAGSSWVNCTTGLPNIPMNSVVVDPANFKRIWVAADVGVYQSLDLGLTWNGLSNGLPNAMAVDLSSTSRIECSSAPHEIEAHGRCQSRNCSCIRKDGDAMERMFGISGFAKDRL